MDLRKANCNMRCGGICLSCQKDRGYQASLGHTEKLTDRHYSQWPELEMCRVGDGQMDRRTECDPSRQWDDLLVTFSLLRSNTRKAT